MMMPSTTVPAGTSSASDAPLPSGLRPDCELCRSTGGLLVVQGGLWRVIRVPDTDFPAFYRIVWQEHLAEFTDLAPAQQQQCWQLIATVEQVLRQQLRPTKINIASLGNMVAHLHWHVIARFDWDSHFPQPVWGLRQREVPGGASARLACPPEALDEVLRLALSVHP